MRKFKDVGRWDHTNAMGAGFAFILMTIITVILSAIWCQTLGWLVWLSVPAVWVWVIIATYFDMTEVVEDEEENE